jgi:hypothetical protein
MDIRGVYAFSSNMKQKIKAKNYAVFCFAGFFFLKFLCYEVIVKQFFYKRSANHYYSVESQKLSPSESRLRPSLTDFTTVISYFNIITKQKIGLPAATV